MDLIKKYLPRTYYADRDSEERIKLFVDNWRLLINVNQLLEKEKESNQVQAVVKPACGHKLTAKQFFIEQYQEGKCEDITTNPEPDFNNLFYLNIYKLMEDYSKSV